MKKSPPSYGLSLLLICILLQACSPNDSEASNMSDAPISLTGAYLSSPFRVLATIENPFGSHSLVLATERALYDCDGGPCANDTSCGGMYTNSACYFFLEPKFEAEAGQPRFLAQYGKGDESLDVDPFSLVFIDAQNVEFQAGWGDAGAIVDVTYRMNIETGDIIETNRREEYLGE